MHVLIVQRDNGGFCGFLCRTQQDEDRHLQNGAFQREVLTRVEIEVSKHGDYGNMVDALAAIDSASFSRVSFTGFLAAMVTEAYLAGLKAAFDEEERNRKD